MKALAFLARRFVAGESPDAAIAPCQHPSAFGLAMTERFLEGLEATEPTPAVRLALRGWMGFCEEASLAWLDERQPARAELVTLLMVVLGSALAAAGERSEDVRAWMGGSAAGR